MEKCSAYLCIVATYFTAPIGVVSVEFDLIVPRGDGSFHDKGRNWACPEVFSSRTKSGVSFPSLFEVYIMFK